MVNRGFTILVPQDDLLNVFHLALIYRFRWVQNGDTGDVRSLSKILKLFGSLATFKWNCKPVLIHLFQVLLVLLLCTVAVDNEDLELGCVGVFVSLLDKVIERLHETLARRAVLSGEENDNM